MVGHEPLPDALRPAQPRGWVDDIGGLHAHTPGAAFSGVSGMEASRSEDGNPTQGKNLGDVEAHVESNLGPCTVVMSPRSTGAVWEAMGLARLMEGKKGVILGVANKRSIAWGITQAVCGAGARVALTYQGERLEESVRSLAAELEEPLVLPCDVTDDAQIEQLFSTLQQEFGKLDFLVHSIAFAPKEALEGEYVATHARRTASRKISAHTPWSLWPEPPAR